MEYFPLNEWGEHELLRAVVMSSSKRPDSSTELEGEVVSGDESDGRGNSAAACGSVEDVHVEERVLSGANHWYDYLKKSWVLEEAVMLFKLTFPLVRNHTGDC